MLAYLQNVPGVDASNETVENEFTWGPNGLWSIIGGTIDASAVDATNTPTTELRQGLMMGRITASGNFTAYNPAATDGSQEPVGPLLEPVNVLNPMTGTTRPKTGKVLYWGHVKVGSLYGFDEYARARLSKRIVFDDLRQPQVMQPVFAPASYTLVASDNDKHFFANGAGAVVFTLPPVALCRGFRFRFTNLVGQNMTVTAPAGTLTAFNNAAATSIAFTTAGNLIGASVEIVGKPDSSGYVALVYGPNTATVS